jgi:hypothetical protein
MRIAALTNVADDSRTMLSGGLGSTVTGITASSHQCYFGHRGAAIRFFFSANLDRSHGDLPTSLA